MNEERITISEERYKEFIKNEAKIEIMVGLIRSDKYFNRDDFMRLFDPDYKEGDDNE